MQCSTTHNIYTYANFDKHLMGKLLFCDQNLFGGYHPGSTGSRIVLNLYSKK